MEGPGGSVVRRTVLGNGIRVVTESVPAARSVAIGFWIGVGSRDEGPVSAGASHFLEHLLFKGTTRRSAFEISAAIEAVGGELNAFTTKECTCFYARVLADDLPMAADVLADMVTGSRIASSDVDAERQVVLEELAMYEDDPANVAHQAFSSLIYGASPLARQVIGNTGSLQAMTQATVRRHYLKYYRPSYLVVTAAGAVEHRQLVRLIKKGTDGWGGASSSPVPARALRGRARRISCVPARIVTKRPTEQAHVALGMPGVGRTDERRWPLAVLDVALGGGMSSRLFQEVREKRGLAYSVATFRSGYSDAGVLGVYAGTHPDRADETLTVVREVLTKAAAEGLDRAEMARSKGQLIGATVLEAEAAGSRMTRLGEAEVLTGRFRSVDDVIELVEAVDEESVAAVAADLLVGPETLSVVGPFDADRVF